MPSTRIFIKEGEWVRAIPPAQSGTVTYSSGVEEIVYVSAVLMPSLLPMQDNAIMKTSNNIGDVEHFGGQVGESIWCGSPVDAAEIIMTLSDTPNPFPIISNEPVGGTLLFPATVRLFSDGSLYDSVEWFKDGVSLGIYAKEMYGNFSGIWHTGDYYVVYTNTNGSTTSRIATIQLGVPEITLQPVDSEFFPFEVGILYADAYGYDSVEWFHDGVATGVTIPEYKISFFGTTLGDYFARFTNATGSTDTNTITVTNKPLK